MSQIYENPVETEVGLMARMLSVYINIKKYAMYIWLCKLELLCTKSQDFYLETILCLSLDSTRLADYIL